MKQDKVTLSLCMIVKDEEDYLPTCLDSIKDIVDEMIIVDTGSKDRTIQIAQQFGANVYSFKWKDDFSAARNESLKHATGKWILYLDADEHIDYENRDKIRKLVHSDNDYIAINVRVKIPQPAGNLASSFSLDYCRIFRNLPQIRFQGRAHEQVLPSILRAGGKTLKSDIVIDHWGFGIKEKRKKNRNERNLRLLEQELAKKPDDYFLMYHLGITYRTLKQHDLAIEQFERLLSGRNTDLKSELLANTHIFLAQLYLGKDDTERAKQNSNRAIDLMPNEIFPYYILATIELEKRNCRESIRLLKYILESKKANQQYPLSIDVDNSQIYLDLGNCYYLIEDYDEALMYYEMAVLLNPGSLEINYNLGRCYIQKDQPKSASKWFERALEVNPAFEAARQELISCYESVLC